jgi:hypothetical protein
MISFTGKSRKNGRFEENFTNLYFFSFFVHVLWTLIAYYWEKYANYRDEVASREATSSKIGSPSGREIADF